MAIAKQYSVLTRKNYKCSPTYNVDLKNKYIMPETERSQSIANEYESNMYGEVKTK